MRRFALLLRHRRRSVAWTLVAMLVALGGGTAVGAATAPASPANPSPAPAPSNAAAPSITPTPADTPAPGPSARTGTAARAGTARRIRGTVTALGSGTWTIRTPAGRTVTVTITPATRFIPGSAPQGTPQSTPQGATGPVAVGDTVVVAGTRTAGGWTATAVHLATAAGPAGSLGG